MLERGQEFDNPFLHGFVHMSYYSVQYTNQVLESIVPSSWSKQLDDDKAPSVHKYSTYIANR